jgi:hypothetical protein
MSHKLRIEQPGARYDLMKRGDQREDIFAARLQTGTLTCVSDLLNEPPETQPQAQGVLSLTIVPLA